MWISRQNRDPKLEAALRPIMDKKNAIGLIDGRINIANSEIQRIYSDQERVRENLKSLKGSAEERALTQRYAKQLGQQEDQVQSERDHIKQLEQERNIANIDLTKLIEDLDLEATM
jgi:DNA repair exonuclease SbcCD ATPase subunit